MGRATANSNAAMRSPRRNAGALPRATPWDPRNFRPPPEFLAERLRGALRRDRDHDLREALRVLPQERLRARPVALPALPEPRAHGALDPELLVVQERLEERERLVELLRVHEVPQGVQGDPSPPRVLRLRPRHQLAEPRGLRAHHLGDGPGAEAVAQ